MKVGWILDDPGYQGGAELTMAEFAARAPTHVDLVDPEDAEVIVIGNCATVAGAELIPLLETRPVVKYVHDMWPHGDPELRDWLTANATLVFTSPLHRKRFGAAYEMAPAIPPAISLDRFRPSRQIRRNGSRAGVVSIAAWRSPGKGGQLVSEWARENEQPVTVYGPGPFLPEGPLVDYRGELEPGFVANALWEHEAFLYLPAAIEPFGRCVVEAWAAHCRVIANHNVGALHWVSKEPTRLESAATDFWRVVCASAS